MRRIVCFLAVLAVAVSCGKKADVPSTAEDWTEDAVIYELNVRQATSDGTFAAAEAKLPELKKLGINVVWLMPLYPIGVEGEPYFARPSLGD